MPTNHADALLGEAAQRDDQAGIAAALARGADANLKIDGIPLLIVAAAGGHEEFVNTLLSSGADPNARDQEGRTALMYAAWLGFTDAHKRIFDQLIKARADVQAIDSRGHSAIHMASRFLNRDMVQRLVDLGAKCDKLTQAIVNGLLSDQQTRFRK